MTSVLIFALPMMLVFVALSGETNWQGFVLGYILSIPVLFAARADSLRIELREVFSQVWNLFVYLGRLALDIFLSAIDVTRILLSPSMSTLDPGLIRVKTQDESRNNIVTAMSAHGITITPGQLVVDIEEEGDEVIMLVHNLSTEKALKTIDDEQSQRLTRIRKVLGYDE